jgi:glycine/serine hydroxymethyltransferase
MGTPSVTTRGMKENQMKLLAKLIKEILIDRKNVSKEVAKLAEKFSAKSYTDWSH